MSTAVDRTSALSLVDMLLAFGEHWRSIRTGREHQIVNTYGEQIIAMRTSELETEVAERDTRQAELNLEDFNDKQLGWPDGHLGQTKTAANNRVFTPALTLVNPTDFVHLPCSDSQAPFHAVANEAPSTQIRLPNGVHISVSAQVPLIDIINAAHALRVPA